MFQPPQFEVPTFDVLVADDDEIVRGSVAEAIAGAGHRVTQASDGEQALALVSSRAFDLAVCDVQMPRLDGMTLFRRLRQESPGTAVVMMTTFGRIPDVVGSLRDGAVDYVTKPFDPAEFTVNVVGPIAERRMIMKKFEHARARFVAKEAGSELVGTSLVMRQITGLVGLAGKSDAPVLVTGERGTGKKLIARMLHAHGPRRDAPLVVVPCALMPQLDSRDSWERWFEAAEGGTLVLDGIDSLPTIAQSYLLRVLGEPAFRASRDREWRPHGVRLVSVARMHPRELVAAGVFLESLWLRLGMIEVQVPALRERAGDLYMLVEHLLRKGVAPAGRPPVITPRAWKLLSAYAFPGNVAELAWAVEHAVSASGGGEIDRDHLPAAIAGRHGVSR
jgi:DNA-binding NtrC family response regulator